ncbi:leucine-rich repeat-containing protein 56 isoform X2 [Hyperolius riggenbachi]|uniref:leucine-rich repeat-containing protein 56 isoform X2 n=1 Tax=Hyperolius riggenbachi TaxID=752182 RepID=UPI0035A371D0
MDKTRERRPSTPSVRVIDLGWQGSLNPNPLGKDEDESLIDEYLSPTRLKALTGVDDLRDVVNLQMCVDTRDHTLGNFGTYMPNLRELKLNNSVILSLRDLGTSLSNLQVLWLARCGLTDLDGIASFFSLKELYLAYNDLTDLSPVSMLENLEILDLEGNNIDYISELQYLALCNNLTTLTVEGNPVCVQPSPDYTQATDYNYRAEIKKVIPQLLYLDDVPADQINTNAPHAQDWLMVKDYIKETVGSQMDVPLDVSLQDVGSLVRKKTIRPSTAQPVISRRPHSAPRPSSTGRTISGLQSGRTSVLSEASGDGPADDESSDLTHGIGKVICGNPIKALRTRKEKLELTPVSTLQSGGQRSEHTVDPVTSPPTDRDTVFAELKSWREKHNEVLKRIQDERAPRVLTITHSDDDEEEEDSLPYTSDDEELEDNWDLRCLVRVTPDTSSPSPRSSASHLGEMTLQEVPHQPSPPVTPHPPSSVSGYSRLNKGADVRAKRLLKGTNQTTSLPARVLAASTYLGDEAFLLTDLDDKTNMSPTLSHRKQHTMIDRRSGSRQSPEGFMYPRSTAEGPRSTFVPFHQPVIRSTFKTPERPSPPHISRPVTANSILQRLPNRPTLLTASKTSNR